jgi:hypothetical protein
MSGLGDLLLPHAIRASGFAALTAAAAEISAGAPVARVALTDAQRHAFAMGLAPSRLGARSAVRKLNRDILRHIFRHRVAQGHFVVERAKRQGRTFFVVGQRAIITGNP